MEVPAAGQAASAEARGTSPLANKLAALSLAVSDACLASADDLAPTAVAALISIRNREPLSIGEIAAVTGLTHSAAVRLVDRLEKIWLVRRQRRVGREVMVEITARGRRRAQQLQEARDVAAEAFLAGLDERDLATLDQLIGKLLHKQVELGNVGVDRLCRMCRPGGCDCGLHGGGR